MFTVNNQQFAASRRPRPRDLLMRSAAAKEVEEKRRKEFFNRVNMVLKEPALAKEFGGGNGYWVLISL